MRTVEEIQKDYAQVCTVAGDLQYRIKCFREELDKANDKLKELNAEAMSVQSQPAEEAKDESSSSTETI